MLTVSMPFTVSTVFVDGSAVGAPPVHTPVVVTDAERNRFHKREALINKLAQDDVNRYGPPFDAAYAKISRMMTEIESALPNVLVPAPVAEAPVKVEPVAEKAPTVKKKREKKPAQVKEEAAPVVKAATVKVEPVAPVADRDATYLHPYQLSLPVRRFARTIADWDVPTQRWVVKPVWENDGPFFEIEVEKVKQIEACLQLGDWFHQNGLSFSNFKCVEANRLNPKDKIVVLSLKRRK